MRVFLAITGASGAPYAVRLLESLVAAQADVGVCASRAGGEVVAWEVYRDRSLPAADAIRRLVGERGCERVTIYDEHDFYAPYASGSARCDAYVICPCSMASIGVIAGGGQANLIHRAASVALKEERRLVLVPRETPLSLVHLRQLVALREAGAVICPAMPGFYTHPDTLSDAIDFVVSKVCDLIGIDAGLVHRWGEARV